MDALSGMRNDRIPTPCALDHTSSTVDRAATGDHPAVHALLLAVYQTPSWEEFQVSLDAPGYDPSDRLVIRRDGRVVAHLRLVPGEIQVGGNSVPACGIEWLATLPEFRLQGFARSLMVAAGQEMRRRGFVLATLRTRPAEPIERFGWSLCDSASYSRANARDILAYLASHETLSEQVVARVWRHVELDAIRHIYHENAVRSCGMRCRNEAYWQWMISRKAHDQIVVAIDRRPHTRSRRPEVIVGYGVLRRERIVEWMIRPGDDQAAAVLLAWSCREAIDGGIPTIFLHAPDEDPRHAWLVEAGGTHHPMRGSDRTRLAVKILDPGPLVRGLGDLLIERTRQASLRRPLAIRFQVGDRSYCLNITTEQVDLSPCENGRCDVTCDASQ
ncbi:MAG: GNAT family N-acetyltransferase, partial [Pirellulales bacterium]